MCIFCKDLKPYLISEYFNVIYDKYPVNKGHSLIIPKRHAVSFFELDLNEYRELPFIILEAKRILNKKFKPDGYNIGMNNGRYAGQTVFHQHTHLIPRYKNDVDESDLKGGIRNFKKSLVEYV
jgi:diadenosine tetraphosphate (Ap4A) HIT family hydrolase